MQAKEVASDAAKAEARAAVAALRAVEAGIAVYAERRDYLKLKDIAEASDVAGKVCSAEFIRIFIGYVYCYACTASHARVGLPFYVWLRQTPR